MVPTMVCFAHKHIEWASARVPPTPRSSTTNSHQFTPPAASAKFARAKAIFATNAVKYHVNKLRAKAWAAEIGQVLHHAIAKDRISSAALREKPDLGKEKLTWLQRQDQDCGSLYGVLPLCIGMPVAAADHLDRSRGILRGCAGEIVGWVWPRMPSGGESRGDEDLERVAGVHLGSGLRPRPRGVSKGLMKTTFFQ